MSSRACRFGRDVVVEHRRREVFRRFWAENPGFIELSRARASSYWSEYYRNDVSKQADFPGLRTLDTLSKLALQSP